MQAMLLREATKPKLDGRVEIDGAFESMTERLAWACTHAEPFPYRLIVNG
jgi:hypothetical protein